ncbi:hypothetical protein ACIFOE_22175 [Paenibacillus sp. NRS-1783]|uniref:hypothetical protein n=1 Tax=Paenibacillus sp. NRS-1783 TaxID=3233907 RepID=UPI003D2A5574
MIPKHLLADRHWRGTLHIFVNNAKLQSYAAPHVDFEDCTINISALKKMSRPWSQSEKFMLNLALHLFNESNKVNLSDMDYLDDYNKEIALKAIQLRFL